MRERKRGREKERERERDKERNVVRKEGIREEKSGNDSQLLP